MLTSTACQCGAGRRLCLVTLPLVVAAVCSISLAQDASGTDALLASLADQDTAADAVHQFLVADPDGVERLISELVEPGQANDAQARRALHGLVMSVSRPGAEPDRRVLVTTFTRQLDGEHPAAVKKFLIRQLRLVGGPNNADAVGQFLLDDQLGEDAAQTLVTFGGEASRAALRQALPQAQGKARATIAHALGVLRDAASVELLITLARDEDRDVRLSALFALANCGDPAATGTLIQAADAEPVYERGQATDACLLLARRLAEADNTPKAERIYRHLWTTRTAVEDRAARSAALSGLAGVLGLDAFDDLLAAMNAQDLQLRRVAVNAAAAMPGQDVTSRWIESLDAAAPASRVAILAVLVQRGDSVALPAAINALDDPDDAVSLAAIDAAATLGRIDAIEPLVNRLDDASDSRTRAVHRALERISGHEASSKLAALLPTASSEKKRTLLAVLAGRNAVEHVQTVLDAAADADENVSAAALTALGRLADDRHLHAMVQLLTNASTPQQRTAAERALALVCDRSEDKPYCAQAVTAGLVGADPEAEASLLTVLGSVGTPDALDVVRAAMGSGNDLVAAAAVAAIANWPNDAAASDMLALARDADDETHRALALRGYVRVAAMSNHRPIARTIQMLNDAMQAARHVEDKTLVLTAMANVHDPDMLETVLGFLDDEQLRAEAALAAVTIAHRVSGADRAATAAAMRKVLHVARDDNTRRRARQVLSLIDSYGNAITAWQVAGPYRIDGLSGSQLYGTAFGPETADATVMWRIHPMALVDENPTVVDLERSIGGDNRVAYLRTHVWSPTAQHVVMRGVQDDDMKVFVNGALVFSRTGHGRYQADLPLEQGWNTLLLKVVDHAGPWNISATITSSDGTAVTGLKYQAHPPTAP
ncbi:MAG: HEAT repeat domain-containing protein [Phycisphaeraceae bacterium]